MNKIIIADWGMIIHIAGYASVKNKAVPPTYTACIMLLSYLRKIGVDDKDTVIIAVDARNSWRKDYEKTYKANRSEQRKQSGLDWDNLFKQFNELLLQLDKATDFHIIKVNRCLSGETNIKVKKREKYIVNIKIGDEVLTYNFKKKKFEYCKVTQLFKNKYKNYYILKFFNKKMSLKVTGNHKVFTQRGWIKVKNLKIKDIIYSYEDYNLLENKKNKFLLGYINGIIAGDGWINKNKIHGCECRIDMCDKEPLQFVQQIIKKLFNTEYKIGKHHRDNNPKWKPYYSLSIFKKALFNFLIAMNNKLSKDKQFMNGFLSGFYDAEGTLVKKKEYRHGLIRISNTQIKLIKYCQEILKKYNIAYKINKFKDKRANRKDIYRLDINKQKEVYKFFRYFYPKIKRKSISNIKNGYQIRKIINIKNNNYYDFYNLENKNHNYFANGMLVHNCEADDIMAVGVKYFKDKEVILATFDSDLEMMWKFPNVKIFSPKIKYKGTKGAYKIRPENFNVDLLIAKKINKETADNLVNEVLNEEDYENRMLCVNLLTLPKFVEEPILEQLKNLPIKGQDLQWLPFQRTMRSKFEILYIDKSKVITYQQCVKYQEKKLLRKKKRRIK